MRSDPELAAVLAVAHAWGKWPHEVLQLSRDELRMCVYFLNERAKRSGI